MSNNSINKNFVYNLIRQIVIIAVPLITTPYVSRVLGVAGIGEYSYTHSLVTYFVLFATLGTSSYAQREIAFNHNNKEKISATFWEVILFRLFTVVLVLGVYLEIFKNSELHCLILAQSLYILDVFCDISWFYQGLQEFRKTSFCSIAIRLVFLGFVFIFVKNEEDVIIYAAGYAIIQIFANLSLWLFLPKYICRTKLRLSNIFKTVIPSFLLFIPTVATQVYTVLDKSMLGYFSTSLVQNGLYEQAEKISRMTLTIYTAYGMVVAPKISSLFKERDTKNIRLVLLQSIKIMWLLVLPMMLGLIAISSNMVPWFYGDGYDGVIPLLKIFSFLLVAVGLSNVFAVQYLVPTKHQNYFTLSVVIGAILNFSMNIILIPNYYALGATIASVVSESIITMIQMYFVVFKIGILSMKDIVIPAKNYLISSTVMFVLISVISRFMTANVINTLFLCLIGVITYVFLLLILKDETVMGIIHSLVKKYRLKSK